MEQSFPNNISYAAVFDPEPTGGFTVTVPAVPACITYGATFEEASANIREALLLCIEDYLSRGEDLPLNQSPVLSSIEFSREDLHA